MKRSALIAVAMTLFFLSVVPAYSEQTTGVNEAVVNIDGQEVIMKAASMEVSKSGIAGDFKLSVLQITFHQIDRRSNSIVKEMILILPSNLEKGERYTTADAYNHVYGKAAIEVKDLQTGKSYRVEGHSSSTTAGEVQIAVDDANQDYTMIKGRFVAAVPSKYSGVEPLTITLSSFWVDGSLLGSPEPAPFDPNAVPTGTILQLTPWVVPPAPAPRARVECPICSGTGKRQCNLCDGSGRIKWYSNGQTSMITCIQCNGSGKIPCISCAGKGYRD